MGKKKAIFRLEICDLKKKDDKTQIYLKGWYHGKDYQINVKKKYGKKVLYSFSGMESKYDVCLYYNEEIADNKYGFDDRRTIDGHYKEIDIYALENGVEKCVFKVRNNFIHNTLEKIKKIFIMFGKAIRLFWKEYHFLVPPSMLKKYFNDFKNRVGNIKSENGSCYNPSSPEEYHEWITRYEIQGKKKGTTDISYIVIGTKKIDLPNSYNLNGNVEELVNNINTKYICFLNDSVVLDKNLNYYLNDVDDDFIYYDQDMLVDNERINPIFKPDWSPDTILGANYIGTSFVVTKEIASNLKNSDLENIYNYILKLTACSKSIRHLPKVLCHDTIDYRKGMQDINYDIVKNYVKDAHIIKNQDNETLTIEYQLSSEPLVSIIIPTKDAPEILDVCLKSIYEKTTYKNFEVIVVDNNSCAETTFKLFDSYKNKYSNFRVEPLKCKFNYSFINNEAVRKFSKGEYVLLLNNDTEVITPNWIELMLGYAMKSHIGTVGVKLLFQDNTIQHAGLIIGKGGIAGHAHYEEERYALSREWELRIPYDVSGNTAACLMIDRKKYDEVNGLEEKLEVAFNDVDFNLKVREAGYNNIYLPNVELYHYESKTRGLDTTVEKQKRFVSEWKFMMDKWDKILEHDPFYNDNFSKIHDYKLEASKEGFNGES